MSLRRHLATGALFVVGLALVARFAGGLVGILPLGIAVAVAMAVAGWRKPAVACGAIALALAVAVLARPHVVGVASWGLGGRVTAAPAPADFAGLIEILGFGLFPLGGLALLAFPVLSTREDATPAVWLVTVSAAAALGAAVVQRALVGEARLLVLPATALAIGAALDRALTTRGRTPALALLAAVAALLVARDVSLEPEALLSSHLAARIADWPPTLAIAPLGFAVAGAAAIGLGLLFAQEDPRARHVGLTLVLGAPVVLGFTLVHVVVPKLSPYLSSKALLDSFRRVAGEGATLGLYQVPASALASLGSAATQPLGDFEALRAHLGAGGFALVPRAQLTPLDARFGETAQPYFVVDASSARHVLLAGRQPAGEPDRNPLRVSVAHAGAPLPTWAAGLAAAAPIARFGDGIELVGSDFPRDVRRGQRLPLVLYFRCRARPPVNQHVFVHFEQPGEPILNGDHEPLGGAFPTQHWRPGDLLRDEHEVPLPRLTVAAGVYRLYIGFWPGGDTPVRLPVTAGGSDGVDRVLLGSVHIR